MKKPRASSNTRGSMIITPGRSVSHTLMGSPIADEIEKILTVTTLLQGLRQPDQLLGTDQPQVVGNFLRTGDLQPLPLFDRLNEVNRPQQRRQGAGIQPGEPTAKLFHPQLPLLQVTFVNVRDLQLTPSRWAQASGYIHNLVVIEVQTGHDIV